MDSSPPSAPVKRKPSESRTTVTYEFTKDPFLCQSYENPWGFFRKGKLLEDMDALAGNIAFKHCEKDDKVPLLVRRRSGGGERVEKREGLWERESHHMQYVSYSSTEFYFLFCFRSHTPVPYPR